MASGNKNIFTYGIKIKLLFFFLLLILSSLAINILSIEYSLNKALTDDLSMKAVVSARSLASNLTDLTILRDKHKIVDLIFNEKTTHKDISYIIVLDENSAPIADTFIGKSSNDVLLKHDLSAEKKEDIKLLRTQSGESFYDVASRMPYGGGILRVGYQKAYISDTINKTIYFLILSFILSLLISIIFAVYFSNIILKPINELKLMAKEVADGDLTKRAKIRSRDEIGYLATVFNKMLDTINDKNSKLKNESAQMKILFSSISEGLILINRDYDILLSNLAASSMLRTRMKNLRGSNLKNTVEILRNMDKIPYEKWPFERVFAARKPIVLKPEEGYYIKTSEGRIFPIEMTISLIENDPLKGIIAVFKDVTELKLIEEEREFSRKNLENVLKSIYIERDNVQEEKNKLEALLKSMGDAVLAIDEEKKIIAFNPVAEKITGRILDKIENKNFSDEIKFIEEETQKEKNDFIDSVLSKGEKVELNNLAIYNKTGKLVLVDINAAPIKNYKGKTIGCIIIFKDVTFKREAERMRTDFISIVSHQLRTPLSAMKWFLEILLDGDVGNLKKEQKDVVNEIHESNNNMISFVNQMLNVSRIESRRLAINVEKIKLCDTISEILKEIMPFFEEKKQILSYKCILGKQIEINADKNLLRNILNSILLNSSRYTPQGGNIELEVSRYDKDFVLFKIKDNGIGIPEGEKEKIFRKFARASNAIRYEANGTGLGLYIVQSIINMVCGKVWFESEENKGTTFYFTLPIENMICEIDESRTKMLI